MEIKFDLITSILLILILCPLASIIMNPLIIFFLVGTGILVCQIKYGRAEASEEFFTPGIYIGTLVLLLYFIRYGVADGMFPIFGKLTDVQGFGNMLAVWVSVFAMLKYERTQEKALKVSYATMIIIALLAVSVWGSTAVMTFLLVFPLVLICCMNPIAKRVKSYVEIFFIEAFVMANFPLLYGYTKIFHTQGIKYSLTTGVIAELLLAVIALVALKEWDKIPKEADLSVIRLCTLRTKCRGFLKICAVFFVFGLFLAWELGKDYSVIDMLLLGNEETQPVEGLLTITVLSFVKGLSKAWVLAFERNIFGIMQGRFGVVGVLIALTLMMYLVYVVFRSVRKLEGKVSMIDLICVVEMIGLFIMPVCLELLPLYFMFIFYCVDSAEGWRIKIQKCKTDSATM